MINEKNTTYLFVGNVTNGFADNADVDIDAQPAGSVVLVKTDQTTVKSEEGALVSGTGYQLINKLTDGTIVRSPLFTSANIVTKGKNAYVAPSEQVSFLGYDGSTVTGLGTITLGDSYIVGLWLNHTKGMYDQKGEVKHISAYATDTTQATVAKLLMESHLKNFSPIREQNPSILCDRIALTASVAAIADNATIYKLTKGLKTVYTYVKAAAGDATLTDSQVDVTLANNVNIPSYNGRTFSFTAVALGAGAGRHVIYIGGTSYDVADAGDAAANSTAIAAAINAGTQASAVAVGAGVTTITYYENTVALPPMVLSSDDDATFANVAVTIASGDAVPVMYKIGATATNSATFELDEPWQGETGYVYEGTTAATNIGIATLTSDTWGLKFTGLKQPFAPQVDENIKISFEVLTDSFGTYGSEYKAVKPNKGHGTWGEVAQLEAYAQGNETWYKNCDYPATNYRREGVAGSGGLGYDVISVSFRNEVNFAASGVSVGSPWTAVIAMRSGLSYDTLDTAFGV